MAGGGSFNCGEWPLPGSHGSAPPPETKKRKEQQTTKKKKKEQHHAITFSTSGLVFFLYPLGCVPSPSTPFSKSITQSLRFGFRIVPSIHPSTPYPSLERNSRLSLHQSKVIICHIRMCVCSGIFSIALFFWVASPEAFFHSRGKKT